MIYVILKKQTWFVVIIFILLMIAPNFSNNQTFIASSSAKLIQNEQVNQIYVDHYNNQGPWNGSSRHPFKNISHALNIAAPYDTIYINDGEYNETVEILFPIQIIGYGSPVINGGYQPEVISVRSSNVLITNLEIIHSDGYKTNAGISIDQAQNVSISHCVIHHTKTGIFLNNSNNITISDSWFFHNGNAIRSNHSSHVTITNCDFARNSMGLFLQYSNEINMSHSTFSANGLSIFLDHSSNAKIRQCNITDNSVNKGGFFFSDSTYIEVSDTLFRHNGVGISFSNVSSAVVDSCNFLKNTHFAISFRETSKQIIISNCSIRNNMRNAIYIESGNSCIITRSHLVDNAIYSILTNPSSTCFATENWWGQSLGPWQSFLSKTNKISFLKGQIIMYPWQKTPLNRVGIQKPVPSPRYNHTFDEEPSIPCEDVDSDGDNVADWWEEKWGYSTDLKDNHSVLDPDGDGLSNVQEYYTDEFGSNPFHKDVFLELDWMYCDNGESNKPDEKWLQKIIDSYADHNITLHIDTGSMGGGEEISYACDHIPTYAALEDIYWTYFLNNDLQNPRKNIFHYGLLCNYCPDLNFPFVGWNAMDSFAISVEWIAQTYPQYQRQQIIAGGITHHLGHTLGLIADTYEGIDNMDTLRFFSDSWREFRNYQSCMNYFYKYRVFSLSDGSQGPGDFNDWAYLDFSFFKKGTYEEK